ncbi:MAG: hypothetical protein ACLP8Y_03385 [Thermoplasmata archaeon]
MASNPPRPPEATGKGAESDKSGGADRELGAYLVWRVAELEATFARAYPGPILNETRRFLRSTARRIAADETAELAREQRAAERRSGP